MEVSVTFLLRNLLVPWWDTNTSLICSRPKAADLWNCLFGTFSHLTSPCCLSAPSSQLSGLKAEDLAVLLTCKRSSNSSSSRPVWKLLLSKASHVLDEALDLLTNKVWISNAPHVTHSWSDLDTVGVFSLQTLDPRNPAVMMILDAIREIRLDTFGTAGLNNPALIQLWFKRRLLPLLPAVSPDFLSCLTTKGLNCSSYQQMYAQLFTVTSVHI